MIVTTLITMDYNILYKKDETINKNKDINIEDKPKDYKTNAVSLSVDMEELHTDITFIVSFDSSTNTFAAIIVPRDTKVIMTDEIIQDLKDRNEQNFIPYKKNINGLYKINGIYALSGEGYRNKYSVLRLEDLIGIEIDYYVRINLEVLEN